MIKRIYLKNYNGSKKMFDIEYKGANSIVISTKKISLVTDPKHSIFGDKDLVIKDGVELATEERFKTGNKDFKLSISYPGSYEVSDFTINGYQEKRHIDEDKDGKKSVIYSVEVCGVRIGILGNIDPNLSDDQLENLGVLDILVLPIGGGGYTLDATAASNIARRSDAKIIIPVHYADDRINYEVTQSDFALFEKELGVDVAKTTKYKVKSATSLPEKMTIVKIERTK